MPEYAFSLTCTFPFKDRIYNSALREKGLYSEFFWSSFSYIRTEYGETVSLRLQSEWRKIWTSITPNTVISHSVLSLYSNMRSKKTRVFYAVNDFSLREWSFTSNHAMIPPKMSIKVLQWRVWHDDKDLDAKYFPLLSIVYFRL